MTKYDPKSAHAEEFIHHEEILNSIEYAEKNKNNRNLIEELLEKASPKVDGNETHCSGLEHREALTLLLCEEDDLNEKIYSLAKEIKLAYYGNRIVIFAPLYLSNYCVNGCVYCPYHFQNDNMERIKLSQEEIEKEVIALQDMGHKRLAIESGEDPKNIPLDYILESINTIYNVKHKNGQIRRVNVNIAATSVENYKKLKDAGIGTYILFQETYNKESYEELHPSGPKSDYNYHTEAMDRAMEAGIDDVGLGVLFGLDNFKYEFTGILMHAEHLEARFGVGPHTISVPRVKAAEGIDPSEFDNSLSDDMFTKIVACLRISVPYTGLIMSTRENKEIRERVLDLGISQVSGASRTSVGGYAEKDRPHDSEQFEVSDERSLDEVVDWLINLGHIPSFCTACYGLGRTGDRFMDLCKSGQIINHCHPNAILTLSEFLEDYGSEKTKKDGYRLVKEEIGKIENDKIRFKTEEYVNTIRRSDERAFRF